MMGKTHILIGITAGLFMMESVINQPQPVGGLSLAFGGLVVGSLLPDLDHPHSLISQHIPFIGRAVSSVTRHRGFMHSVIGVAVWLFGFILLMGAVRSSVSADAYTISVRLFSWGLVGYVLHIGADMLTISGVKLFYPLRFNVGLPIFSTGGIREKLLRFGLGLACLLQILRLIML